MNLIIKDLNKSYGNLNIFKNFNIEISKGKITCILGPSGCGKTTLLNIISGTLKVDKGNFYGFNDKLISYIFQEPRLLEWMTVWDNIDFILRDIYSKNKRKEIVNSYINMVDLNKFKNYYPQKLSGGMKQRVSIARAFAYPSDILIMDEPFSGLDLKLKENLIKGFLKLWKHDLRTVIFVTHNIEEALLLSDEIYILSNIPTKIKKKLIIGIDKEKRKLQDKNMEKYKQKMLI